MLEIASPLASVTTEPRPGGAVAAAVTLTERAPRALAQIAGWASFDKAVWPALSSLGLDEIGDYRWAQVAVYATTFRIAPDRLLIAHRDPGILAEALGKLDPARAASLDLTHARWIFGIGGAEASAFLARLVPLDLAPDNFPVGSFAQTGLHHVGVLLHSIGPEGYELYVPVTWAQSIWSLMCETAEPFGYRLDAGGR